MTALPLANNFLAGSLITLLMPVLMLIALVVWYMIVVKRVPGGEPAESERSSPAGEPRTGAGGAGGGPPARNP
jgi:hypothetical protein